MCNPAGQAPQLALADVTARLRAAGCVFAEDEAQLLTSAAADQAGLAAMVDRRAAGVPLEHVLGWAEFCGLRIAVGPGVFVPRRRTEFLVQVALSAARQQAGGGQRVVVVDVCCGSGAIAAALAAGLGGAEVHAVDIDPAAVACARRNLAATGPAAAGGQVYEGDLYGPLPARLRGRVQLLTANVPYVPTAQMSLLPAEARVHEPRQAVDGGFDGLDVLRRVAAQAPQWLAPGGLLLTETSKDQAPAAAGILARAGLIPRIAACEEMGATVVSGSHYGT